MPTPAARRRKGLSGGQPTLEPLEGRVLLTATYTVSLLGMLGDIFPSAINDNGQVVGAVRTSGDAFHAFLYDGTMHDLGTLGGSGSGASDINDSGQVVGSASYSGTASHAFLYDGTVHDLGTLGGYISSASAINDSGQVVGAAEYPNWEAFDDAFLYDGTMHDLGTLGGRRSNANDINDSGQVVGAAYTTGNVDYHAFLYDGTMHDLGTLGGISSAASAINDSGQVVGDAGTSGNASHAFLYDGTMHDLGTLGGISSAASAINDSGQVVGDADTSGNASHAFLYDGTMHDLNDLIAPDSGWAITGAQAINDKGWILAYGTNPSVGSWVTQSILLKPTTTAAATTTTIGSSVNSSDFGQAVMLTATVTANAPGGDTPTGTVNFFDGNTLLGSGDLDDSGTATFTTREGEAGLSVGTHSITAVYSGDANFLTSTSDAISQVVVAGSISGTVFGDANWNGQRDAGEDGRAGVVVYLDLNSDGQWNQGEPEQTTDASGSYLFEDLSAGTYSVGVAPAADTIVTTPPGGFKSVVVAHDQQATAGDIGVSGLADYETLARGAAYQNWSVDPSKTADGWTVANVFSGAGGFYALGLTAQGHDPVLLLRGTSDFEDLLADASPKGVGWTQFVANKAPVEQWLKDEAAQGKVCDIVGHSLGGALAQWFAADWTHQGNHIGDVVTFNSPGISADYASEFVPALAQSVLHYITSGDVVSLAGSMFIPGQYCLATFTGGLNIAGWLTLPLDRHLDPVTVASVGTLNRPADCQLSAPRPTDSLNSPFFMYSDVNYLGLLSAAEAIILATPARKSLATLPPALVFRGTTEKARQNIGRKIDAIVETVRGVTSCSDIDLELPPVTANILKLPLRFDDMSIHYHTQQDDAFKMQGQVSIGLPKLPVLKGDFSGPNYIELLDGQWQARGTLSLNSFKIKGWGINKAVLSFDTGTGEAAGSVKVALPMGPVVNGTLSFQNGYPNAIAIGASNLNLDLAWPPVAYLQSVQGSVRHLSAFDPLPTVFSGSVGLTFGPEVQFGSYQGSILRADINGSFNCDYVQAGATLTLLGGVATETGTLNYNCSTKTLAATGTFSVLGGVFKETGKMVVDSKLNIDITGKAAVAIPAIPVLLPDGLNCDAGKAQLHFTNNNQSNDDYVQAWVPLLHHWAREYFNGQFALA